MKPTYRIKDWDKHFENHESRKVKRSYWVPVPNRHDGKSYRRIASHPDGVAVFAAWVLMLEAASKMPTRGVLADEDGPLDADDLASMTGFPAAIFNTAFELLTQEKIGWLSSGEVGARRRRASTVSRNVPQSPAISRNLPTSPGEAGEIAVEQKGTELQGTEGKGTEGSAKAGASANPSQSPQEFTIWKLAVGKLMTAGMEEQEARSFVGAQCKAYSKPVVSDAITRMLAAEPADPKTYLVGILRNGNSNGPQSTNNEPRRPSAAERNSSQLMRNLAVVEDLRREGRRDPD